MLYDGAVRFLHQAKEGFAEKNIEKQHNNITKVQNIITEFESTLDMEAGGEFAKNLFNLYEFSYLPTAPDRDGAEVNKSYPTCCKTLPDISFSFPLNICSIGLNSTFGTDCSTDV